jgi:glycosyltransferase involved in cell wall biosynthesis
MKLVIVSICKDEAKTIGEVLDQIPKSIKGIDKIEKLVLDDGSTDETAKVARAHGAEVISDGVQKRLAIRFRQATELVLARGADIMVNIDGDLQFNPKDIPKLIQPILEGSTDFVAANRFVDHETGKIRRPAGMPIGKYFGNKLGARIVGSLSGQRFSDVTCGFRAYNRDALFALNLHSSYTYTQESFQVLAMKRLRIASMPVHITYYEGRQSRVVRSFWAFLFGSALSIVKAYRDYAPMQFFGRLGALLFIPGVVLVLFAVVHWVITGSISPFKAFGLIGLYLLTLGFFIWVLGLVADMLDRMLGNQEKIIEQLKRQRYDDKK